MNCTNYVNYIIHKSYVHSLSVAHMHLLGSDVVHIDCYVYPACITTSHLKGIGKQRHRRFSFRAKEKKTKTKRTAFKSTDGQIRALNSVYVAESLSLYMFRKINIDGWPKLG